MARNIFGGNLVLDSDSIQNGLCGYGHNTPVMEQVVAPISIKTAPVATTAAPVPVQNQTPQAPKQTPAPQAHQQVHPSTEAAMFMSAHAYVQALRAQEQAAANQKLADARHKGQVAFNKMVGEAIGECAEGIHQNSEAIRGLQHRAKNAEERVKAQEVEMQKLKAQQAAQQAEMQKIKAQQAAQAAELEKLKAHNKVQDKRLDNLESNMRKANTFMQKFGKKK